MLSKKPLQRKMISHLVLALSFAFVGATSSLAAELSDSGIQSQVEDLRQRILKEPSNAKKRDLFQDLRRFVLSLPEGETAASIVEKNYFLASFGDLTPKALEGKGCDEKYRQIVSRFAYPQGSESLDDLSPIPQLAAELLRDICDR